MPTPASSPILFELMAEECEKETKKDNATTTRRVFSKGTVLSFDVVVDEERDGRFVNHDLRMTVGDLVRLANTTKMVMSVIIEQLGGLERRLGTIEDRVRRLDARMDLLAVDIGHLQRERDRNDDHSGNRSGDDSDDSGDDSDGSDWE